MEKVTARIVYLLSILQFLTLAASAAGYMEVRNFTRDDYKGGPQNWAVAQDSLGCIFVGNRDGMLSFDGERWNKYVLPNFSAVRSLLYDHPTERIYAGGSEEFGYFSPGKETGSPVFTSLLPTIEGERPRFTEVWHIHRRGKEIWFQTDFHLYVYDGERTRVIPSQLRISTSAMIGGTLYLGFESGELATVTDGRISFLPGAEMLEGIKIQALFPLEGKLMIGTPLDGLFCYDRNKVIPFPTDLNPFLRENRLFSVAVNGDDYVFGTVAFGAVVKNRATGVTRYINRMNGLLNNTVLNSFFDFSGNIWLCLDNGLDYGVYNSPLSNIIGSASDVGAGYASSRSGDRIYFGTNQGLFSTQYPFLSTPAPSALRREFTGQVWSITEGDGVLFVAGDPGVYVSNGAGFSKVDGVGGSYKVEEIPGATGMAIASCYDGFHLLLSEGSRWHDSGLIEGSKDVRGIYYNDDRGNLWLSHWMKGVYRLHYDLARDAFVVNRLYIEKDGLPTTQNNSIAILDGRPVFTNVEGFFTYDYTNDRIVADSILTALFGNPDGGSLHVDGDNIMLIGRSGIKHARKDSAGNYVSIHPLSIPLTDRLVNGYENVAFISPEEVLVANQNGFWSLNPTTPTRPRWTATPFVSEIYANTDSLIYRAPFAPGKEKMLTLPFNLNSLRFEFACPEYNGADDVLYSSYLENYDKDWSQYSTESSREYTRLWEGTYTLRLRTIDLNTGIESETSFRFRVAPPWYRSAFAFTLYALLIIGSFWWLVNRLKRWKHNAEREAADRKEEEFSEMRRKSEREALEKDYEISKLKSEQLEVDVKHKSDELSSATMNLIRKNEILHEIASRIAKIQQMSSLDRAVSRQLDSIQTSIKENISHDDDWATFNRNFDIVYGDFTKRLREQFPQLSAADIRLACYLKMGLTSKDIAPLINISYKSVEMARYRLRKKMNLDTDLSITDYLAQF